jgi:hypothetical protein
VLRHDTFRRERILVYNDHEGKIAR